MILPTLYKKNTDGSAQQWAIKASEDTDSDAAFITTEYGKVGGKPQTATETITEGKNIGKSNETTPFEQASKEAEARWTAKKKKGYVEVLEDAMNGATDSVIEGGVFPMLAKSLGIVVNGEFVPSSDAAKFNFKQAWVQPKLDGVRCIAVIKSGKATLWTRTRKPITSIPHIVAALKSVFYREDIVLDGELYNHDYRDNFEDLVSLIKASTPKPGHEVVQYHIYDVVDEHSEFNDRTCVVCEFLDSPNTPECLVDVETLEWEHFEDARAALYRFTCIGYEGVILRDGSASYETNKRSTGLMKLKEFVDDEFPIVDVVEGKGKMAGKAIFVCQTNDGVVFLVKMEGSLDRLADIWRNRAEYYGKALTVRYQNLTASGAPRFPVGRAIRDYE